MKPKDYLTIPQAIAAIGCGSRTIYRLIDRVGRHVVTEMFGRTLIHKKYLPLLKAEYAPFGSERRHEMAVEFGRQGGSTKAENLRKTLQPSSASGKRRGKSGGST